jgi:hypothetical protein
MTAADDSLAAGLSARSNVQSRRTAFDTLMDHRPGFLDMTIHRAILFAASCLLLYAMPPETALAGDARLVHVKDCRSTGDCVCDHKDHARQGYCIAKSGRFGAKPIQPGKPGCRTFGKMCDGGDTWACQIYLGTCT